MSDTQTSGIRRLPKDLRDQVRRDQIVDAARQCVIRHGFHAASMAEIAVVARMSVGQIYRYFPNKEAIVHAIVERIVAQRLQGMMETASSEDLPTVLAERIAAGDMEYREDHILMLEVTAEATRNPAVAEIVRQAGERLNKEALATFRHRHPEVDEREVAGRLELIAVLFEGSVFRHMTQQQGSTAVPAALYRDVLVRLLGP